MPTQITDAGASLKLTIGAQTRNIMKAQIIEISVIKTNIIKIDIGQGALHNIFILFTDVDSPVFTNPEQLKDQLNTWCLASASGGNTVDTAYLSQIASTAGIIFDFMDYFKEPLLIDESNPNEVYEGFAVFGTHENNAGWAIKRTRQINDQIEVKWANGDRGLTKRWTDRATLTYL